MKKLILASLVLFLTVSSFALPMDDAVVSFAGEVASRNKIKKSVIINWLKKADKKPEVLSYMDRQAEGKPWYQYKPFFINDKKIKKGKRFKRGYPKSLRKVSRSYGVDPYVVLAILGVETDFGTYRLPYRAMDALSTLAFYYPRRAKYFKQELEALMVYCYRNRMNPYNFKSSYAGAVGMPQFMPSNIKKYGVDFSGDRRVNLVKSGSDAIGSIGNYLKKHGWKRNRPIAVKARVWGDSWKKYSDKGFSKQYSIGFFKKQGVHPTVRVSSKEKGVLVSLEGDKGIEHWILFHNFRMIMRYNPSVKYAMAVTLLSKYLQR